MKFCVTLILQHLLSKRESHEKPISDAHSLFKDTSEWPTALSTFIDRYGRHDSAQTICTQCRRAGVSFVEIGAATPVLYLLTSIRYIHSWMQIHHQVLLLLVDHRASMKSFQALRSAAVRLTSFHDLPVPLISATFCSEIYHILSISLHSKNPILFVPFMPKGLPLVSVRVLFSSFSLTIMLKVCLLLAYNTRSQWRCCHLSLWAGWFS
jgi:hypothetical protein